MNLSSDLNLFFIAAFFVLGTIVGSFLSALIYRVKHKVGGMVFGRSFCPHCKVEIRGYDMIPLLSYLFLGGKCRSCGKSISVHYFLIELVTGLIFAFTFFNFNFLEGVSGWITGYWMLVFAIAIAIFFFDAKYQEIPLELTVPLALVGGLGSAYILGLNLTSLILGAITGKLFFYAQYKVSKGKWVGLGDSDLGMAIGMILGAEMLLIALLISYIVASIYSLGLIASKKATMKSKVAFGPFLVLGLYVTALYGPQLAEWYFNLTLF